MRTHQSKSNALVVESINLTNDDRRLELQVRALLELLEKVEDQDVR